MIRRTGSGLCSPLAQSFSRPGGKKRALSVSPSPDLELHGRIRSSPSALYSAAAAYGASCSRSSSTSGSYGHLNPLAFTMQHHPSVISPQVQQLLRSASGLHLPWHNAASMPSAAHHPSYNIHMLPVPSQDTTSQVSPPSRFRTCGAAGPGVSESRKSRRVGGPDGDVNNT